MAATVAWAFALPHPHNARRAAAPHQPLICSSTPNPTPAPAPRAHHTADIVIIGGGPAGIFASIHAASPRPSSRALPPPTVVVLEQSPRPLSKVLISGGGRCNLTHHEPDPARLTQAYARGARELRGPFTRFGVPDAVAWFERRGVAVKVEEDGRVFPRSDDARTVARALEEAAEESGVRVRVGVRVEEVVRVGEGGGGGFEVRGGGGEVWRCGKVLLATGSARAAQRWAEAMGHVTEEQVPALFTLRVEDERLAGLAGLSLPNAKVELVLDGQQGERRKSNKAHRVQSGAILVTHWGLSGPAVLRLSSFAARELHAARYHASLRIDWMPCRTPPDSLRLLTSLKTSLAPKLLSSFCPLPLCPPTSIQPSERAARSASPKPGSLSTPARLPKRLWSALVRAAGVPASARWGSLSAAQMEALVAELHGRGVGGRAGTGRTYAVRGKAAFKEEFVTCGGVALRGIGLATMESRTVPGLYFAGEVVDVDGVTGGYNFQAAWTMGYLAGRAMGGNSGRE